MKLPRPGRSELVVTREGRSNLRSSKRLPRIFEILEVTRGGTCNGSGGGGATQAKNQKHHTVIKVGPVNAG